MSYGPHTRNPIEHDESPIEDDALSPCGCGDSTCWIDGNDASNVRVGGKWYGEYCASKLTEVIASVETDRQADDDQFNRVRR